MSVGPIENCMPKATWHVGGEAIERHRSSVPNVVVVSDYRHKRGARQLHAHVNGQATLRQWECCVLLSKAIMSCPHPTLVVVRGKWILVRLGEIQLGRDMRLLQHHAQIAN